jgi:formylglycine-generating enzyme required for sulfatase activity
MWTSPTKYLWFGLFVAAVTVVAIVCLRRAREKDNPIDGLVYVWIKPGSFFTGCDPKDEECMGRERPRREIIVNKGFWIGRTEVTQRAFQKVMGQNPSRYQGASLPVEQVDWNSAEKYCKAVGMRLPTESEWEFAAFGGTSTPRYGPLNDIAWFDGNSADKTHPVGTRKPNNYGLFDMLGNVWEWVEDQSNVDPQRRIMKGGSFYNISRDLRVPNRETPLDDIRHRNIGFRCVEN